MSDFMSNFLYLLLPSGISVLAFCFLFRIIRRSRRCPDGYRHANTKDLIVLCFLLLCLILYFSLVSPNEGFYRA